MAKETLDAVVKLLTAAIDRLSGTTGPQRKRLHRLPGLMVLPPSTEDQRDGKLGDYGYEI
jgi:hypothetical protein